jgi:hypothetical protein
MKPNPAPPEWLTALGIASPCISNNSSANERGRSFSIRPLPGDVVWRVHVDGCWVIGRERRVDYLFWARSSTGRRRILLVELKGKDFGSALQQVEASLQQLCKKADGHGIHTGVHQTSPGHDLHEQGVRAYVVLSKGKGVPQRQSEKERLRRRYDVIVIQQSQRMEVIGVDALP